MSEAVVQIAIFVALVVVGFTAGRWNERRHFARLAREEAEFAGVIALTERRPAWGEDAVLVVGSVVIAEDYFKRIAANIRSLFGGHVRSYETLLERGRREAVVRMKRAAAAHGAHMVWGVRFETASLSEDAAGQALFSAEFLAYGTAVRGAPPDASPG